MLAFAPHYVWVLVAAAMVGVGSAIFHPESSRVARMASGGQHGLAQSLFQVGGNAGQSLGPLLAAFIVIPGGQRSVVWFTLVSLTGMILLFRVGGWYKARLVNYGHAKDHHAEAHSGLSSREDSGFDCGSAGADVFEVLLSGEYRQLLHFLPDRQVSPAGSPGAVLPVCVPCIGGCGNDYRWPCRGSHRPQAGDLVLHSRSAAILAGAASCRACCGRWC